jgi:O-antigen/teichoic acid export membrane protein
MSVLRLSLVGLGSRVAILALGTVNTVMLARYLEPRGRGEYFVFHTILALLTTFGDLGLAQSANVYSGQHAAWRARIHVLLARFAVGCWLATAAVALVVHTVAGETLVPHFPAAWIPLVVAALPMMLYANFWNSMMIGAGGIWQYNLVRLGVTGLSVVLTLVFVVLLRNGVTAALLINVFALAAQSVSMGMLVRTILPGAAPAEPPPPLGRQMFLFGLRGYGNSVSGQLWLRVPVLLLNGTHGPAAVGIFSVAQVLADSLLLPIQAMQDAIYGKICAEKRGAATAATNRYIRLAGSAMALIWIACEVLAGFVVVRVFGGPYAGAVPVFRILILGSAVMVLPMLLAPFFLAQLRRPGLLSLLSGLSVAVSSLLSWVLIPGGGAAGAALALALTQVLGTGIVVAIYVRLAPAALAHLFLPRREDLAIAGEQVESLVRWGGR